MAHKINYHKLGQVDIRNLSPSNDFHDVVKLLLVRLIRRKHRNSIVYTEYDPHNPNRSYPDIWAEINGDVHVFEIQKTITTTWRTRIKRQYEEINIENLEIIPLENLPRDIDELTEVLMEYVP